VAHIRFENVSKTFAWHGGRQLLRGYLAGLFRRPQDEVFHALREVSFQVNDGESLAVIGSNGAGKTTLLSLVAGVAFPDSGRVTVSGSIAPLLELGSGFHYDLTGRENIHLNAAMLGLHRAQVEDRLEQIIDFSGIREFIDEPVRTYSSGMNMRLAFAVAIESDPEILIVDEVLAVGDHAFQARCLERIRDFHERGKMLLAVSHAAATIRELCQRAIWLDHGRLLMDGDTASVVAAYERHCG
jgi:ABC-type polysaccharide/polyol phosphate transport system ATPase subunit